MASGLPKLYQPDCILWQSQRVAPNHSAVEPACDRASAAPGEPVNTLERSHTSCLAAPDLLKYLVSTPLYSIDPPRFASEFSRTPRDMAGLRRCVWLTATLVHISLISGQYTPGSGSVVKCDFSALSKSSYESVKVGAHAAATTDAALCGNNTDAEAVAVTSALSISRTFAEAFFGSIVDCYAEGHAYYKINGMTYATAQASAFAEAFAEAYTVSKTCHKCLAASELIADSYAEIFLSAAKESELSIEKLAEGGQVVDNYTHIEKDLVERTMVAFAQVIVKAKSEVNECDVSAQVEVATGDIDDLNTVQCEANVTAVSDYQVHDSLVDAADDLALSVCDLSGQATDTLQVDAEAIAKAAALAISAVSAECVVDGQGTACALGLAGITETAEAVARAYAGAFVNATAECDHLCHTEKEDLAAAIGSVIVTAASNVYKVNCTGPNSYFNLTAFDLEIVESSVTALAQVLAHATVATDDQGMTACVVDMELYSSIVPEAAPALELAATRAAGSGEAPGPTGSNIDRTAAPSGSAPTPGTLSAQVSASEPTLLLDQTTGTSAAQAPQPEQPPPSPDPVDRISAAVSVTGPAPIPATPSANGLTGIQPASRMDASPAPEPEMLNAADTGDDPTVLRVTTDLQPHPDLPKDTTDRESVSRVAATPAPYSTTSESPHDDYNDLPQLQAAIAPAPYSKREPKPPADLLPPSRPVMSPPRYTVSTHVTSAKPPSGPESNPVERSPAPHASLAPTNTHVLQFKPTYPKPTVTEAEPVTPKPAVKAVKPRPQHSQPLHQQPPTKLPTQTHKQAPAKAPKLSPTPSPPHSRLSRRPYQTPAKGRGKVSPHRRTPHTPRPHRRPKPSHTRRLPLVPRHRRSPRSPVRKLAPPSRSRTKRHMPASKVNNRKKRRPAARKPVTRVTRRMPMKNPRGKHVKQTPQKGRRPVIHRRPVVVRKSPSRRLPAQAPRRPRVKRATQRSNSRSVRKSRRPRRSTKQHGRK
eukprot:jgi/Ulvmu1/11930/UM082_0009.1